MTSILTMPLSKRPRKSVCGLTRDTVTTASASRAFLSQQTGSPQLLVPMCTAVMSVLTGTPRACSLTPYSASSSRWPSAVAPPWLPIAATTNG